MANLKRYRLVKLLDYCIYIGLEVRYDGDDYVIAPPSKVFRFKHTQLKRKRSPSFYVTIADAPPIGAIPFSENESEENPF